MLAALNDEAADVELDLEKKPVTSTANGKIPYSGVENDRKVVANDSYDDLAANEDDQYRRGTDTDHDYLERSNARSQEATISQAVDATFFSSMRVTSRFQETISKDPLVIAITSRDDIDVQMILDELGPAAAGSVSSRDQRGRTSLHIAALSKSPRIVALLLGCYRIYEGRQLEADLFKLEEEYNRTITEIMRKDSLSNGERKESKVSRVSQCSSVREWFDLERARKLRQFEFRAEIWWAKSLCTRDNDGRTPLHYAVGSGAEKDVLEVLILSGRGHYFVDEKGVTDGRTSRAPSGKKKDEKIHKILKPIFNERSIYDLSSGREMATYAKPSYALKSLSGTSNIAEPKTSTGRNLMYSASTRTLRHVAWDLAGASGNPHGSNGRNGPNVACVVDYEVVIPWVLRNMLRSSTERSTNTNSTSGIEQLEDLLMSSELSMTGVFVVAELGSILGELGIRVTTDVLRELCRRYPGAMSDIREKWDWIAEKQKDEQRRASKALADELDDNINSMDEKGSTRDYNRAENKNSLSSSSSSKYLQSDHDYDDEYDGRRSKSSKWTERESEKGSGIGSTSSTIMKMGTQKMAPSVYSSLVMDKEDENLAVDIRQLIEGVGSNNGYRLTDTFSDVSPVGAGLDTSNTLRGLEGEDGYEALLSGKGGTGDVGGGAGEMGGNARMNKGTRRNTILSKVPSSVGLTSITLPSCLTISTIIKARRNVINICDSRGRSPLLVASALGLKTLVSTLLSLGGDISVITEEGHNAFTVARTPSVRALPERMLLTWMNKREHSSENRGSCERKTNDAMYTKIDDLLENACKLQRDPQLLESTLEGSSSSNCTSRILNGFGVHTAGDVNKRDEGIMRSQWMGTEERARVVSGLLGPLEGLKSANWAYCRPPLMWAVHNGLLSAVRDLLPSKLFVSNTPQNDPNCYDSVGRGPLHECAALVRSGRLVLIEAAASIAEVLIASGARLNDTSVSGRTPLHELFCANQDESVSCYRVSSDGTAAVCPTMTNSPHPSIISKGRRLLLMTLLQFGANPLLLDRHGLAPIHYCVREDYSDCLLEILRVGTDGTHPSRFQQTPLHVACRAGAVKSAHVLCRWDADHIISTDKRLGITKQRDGQGKLPTQLIPRSASSRCLETLWGACRAGDPVRASEIISAISNATGRATWSEVDSSNAELQSLSNTLDRTAGNDVDDDLAYTRTRLSASTGGKELWLVDGVDSKTRRLRWTALHACVIGWAESRTLTQMAEKKNIKSHWNEGKKISKTAGRGSEMPRVSQAASIALRMPLSERSKEGSTGSVRLSGAVLSRHSDVITLLLQRHAFVDSLEVHSRSPLMLAAACNLCEACGLLLDAGADVHSSDIEGNTALHLAYAYGSMSCVMLLEGRGADSEAVNSYSKIPSEEAGRAVFMSPLVAII